MIELTFEDFLDKMHKEIFERNGEAFWFVFMPQSSCLTTSL